ncbi:MAG: PAC2 family protein [Candidatus Altiarchaeota archaeon]|nr:PAC2 family protein [Candidatus Altiarchaeota archaeon]
MGEDVRIVEDGVVNLKQPSVVLGFPDVGLVGAIATYHLVDKLDLKQVASIESDDFPPVVVVHNGRPVSPLRIYGNRDLLVVVSEIPIKSSLLHSISRKLVEWFRSKNVKLVISLGGVPHPHRIEVENPKVYAISVNKETDKLMDKRDIQKIEEGISVGAHSLVIYECMKNKINALYLMAESHAKYPDPESAAAIIQKLNTILDLNVEVKELIEKGEEIKIQARDLMKRTENVLHDIDKEQENEIPMMYR